MVTEDQVWKALEQVTDPEFPVSLVDLGLIYEIQVNGDSVKIDMTFTAMGCPAIDMITSDVKEAVQQIPEVKSVQIEIVWHPPWTKQKISTRGREILQYYGVGV